ncbi:MAG: rRNA pseudouridine synthase [Rickettsiaceae bacterium]|nr:rRNA pseudouridine synthase [Rickettsiaceae bacterium]
MSSSDKSQRINKYIAAAGICSRRKAEELIIKGRVKIDGKVINTPAINISSDNVVEVNDKVIKPLEKIRIWRYYKPVGLITTHHDPQGRETVFANLPDMPKVISIGRLDMNSEGLLILTNNGEFARKMELPESKIERVYKVRAYGDTSYLLKFLTKNKTVKKINIAGITYRPKMIKLIKQGRTNSWFEVVLCEGKNREIRKIFSHFNLTVNRLIRTKYGKWELDKLKPGECLEEKSLK